MSCVCPGGVDTPMLRGSTGGDAAKASAHHRRRRGAVAGRGGGSRHRGRQGRRFFIYTHPELSCTSSARRPTPTAGSAAWLGSGAARSSSSPTDVIAGWPWRPATASSRRPPERVRHPRRRCRVARRDRRRRRCPQADRPVLVRQQGGARRRRARGDGRRARRRHRRRRAGGARRSAGADRRRRQAVFRLAVRRPALLGLVGELSRLPPHRPSGSARARRPAGRARRRPTSAPRWPPAGCAAAIPASSRRSPTGRSRASPPSPRRCARSAGRPTAAGLRRLRAELRAFLRAALAP